MECAKEEHEHAEKFIKYQNQRGGRVVFQPIDRPAHDSWDTPLMAVEYALSMEKQVNQVRKNEFRLLQKSFCILNHILLLKFVKALLDLHKVASNHNDSHLTNFLEEEYLKEQAESINKLAKYVTNLQRVGDGLGVYIFDKDLQWQRGKNEFFDVQQ